MSKIIVPAIAALCLCTGAFAAPPPQADVAQGDVRRAKSAPVPGSVATTVSVPSTGKDFDALQSAVTDAWENMPLTARHVMFVAKTPENYGAWVERPTNVFKVGEKLITYAEPIGYTWKPRGDTYDFGLTTDFAVKSADGKILGGQEKFFKVEKSSHAKMQELMLTMTMSLDGITAGKYVLEYTLHDNGSDKTTTFDQPFTIGE